MLIVVGVLLAVQNSGFSLGTFAVIVGALSVGVGFGLQHVVNNFVSGLIVLLERPIEVGDWIDIDDTRGKVTQIGARSTTVVTRDNISIISGTSPSSWSCACGSTCGSRACRS